MRYLGQSYLDDSSRPVFLAEGDISVETLQIRLGRGFVSKEALIGLDVGAEPVRRFEFDLRTSA